MSPTDAFSAVLDAPHFWLLVFALLVACCFEFINGFHDTANAVATVIYTRSLKPWTAVTLSGIFNFLGVLIGGTAVAMSIVKLLPIELLITHDVSTSMAMVFAMLFAAILWNLGTWYFGLPASSSHTLIGAILGIGFAHALISGIPLSQGVSWSKAADIGLALLISPIVGFVSAAALLILSKRFFKNPALHEAAPEGERPPWRVRATLILTSSGVSLAHGSNDGQKGVGLVMLILIALLPSQFALKPSLSAHELTRAREASHRIETLALRIHAHGQPTAGAYSARLAFTQTAIAAEAAPTPALLPDWVSMEFQDVSSLAHNVNERLTGVSSIQSMGLQDRFEIRAQLLKLDQHLSAIEKSSTGVLNTAYWREIQKERAPLKTLIEYAPTWVIFMVALALGLGTMIGWKRVAVTIGERIGKTQLSYAKGAVAQLVAMSTIGISALVGMPVSTTHVLSSGIAGTMVASRAGIQPRTVKGILLAWVFTLPASMALSAVLYWILFHVLSNA